MFKCSVIIALCTLLWGCNPVEVKKEYNENGNIKTIQSYVLGTPDGFKMDYYPDEIMSDSSS